MDLFSAEQAGAPHLRRRMFVLAWPTALANSCKKRCNVGTNELGGPWALPATPGPRHWPPEPDVGRVVDGPASRMDSRLRRARLAALGDGCVPAQSALAFLNLLQRAGFAATRGGDV